MSTYTSPMSLGGHTANMGAVLRISLVAAMGGFLFGYDSAVINGATGAMQEYFDVSPGALGSAVASALLGAAAGAFFGGRLADSIGRVKVMRIAAILFLMPMYAIRRVPAMRKYAGATSNVFVVVVGLVALSSVVYSLIP